MQSFADNWAARLRTPEWFRADPWQTIVSLSAGYLLAYSAIDTEQGDTIWRFIVLPVIAVAFALRFRQPEIAIAITLGATYLAMFVLDGSVLICFGLVELCLLSLGIQRPVQVAVLIAIIVTGFLYLPAKEISGVDWTVVPSSGVIISLITASGAAAGIGIAIRAQRNFIAAIQLQTLQAIVSRESEARRQVTEERLRIARDLHDAVAHHIAVVSVFIGLARTAPAQAEQALASAQESTRSVLAELQQILQLLRDNDSLVDPPSPGMDAIDDLLDSFSRIGLEVDAQINGSPAPVSTAVGLAIYRVLQESLTNSHKYGDGRATLTITHSPNEVELVVRNAIAVPGKSALLRSGHEGFGLPGMRERVRSVGGRLEYRTQGGTFSLIARIPAGPAMESAS